MPRLYVVDTNVVISGVLLFQDRAAPARILEGMIAGWLPCLISADLLAEYRRILLRPSIVARHGLSPAQIHVLLATLTAAAYLRQPPDDAAGDADDPAPLCPAGDEHLIRLLAHEPWSVLVSGDVRLLRAVQGWREAMTPAEAVVELGC